ncbi:MAG: hypothetical protein JWQ71_4473 [Pedosphaera sp.]|nr:hypothetical protein [Pedosphaera sp.]
MAGTGGGVDWAGTPEGCPSRPCCTTAREAARQGARAVARAEAEDPQGRAALAEFRCTVCNMRALSHEFFKTPNAPLTVLIPLEFFLKKEKKLSQERLRGRKWGAFKVRRNECADRLKEDFQRSCGNEESSCEMRRIPQDEEGTDYFTCWRQTNWPGLHAKRDCRASHRAGALEFHN